MCMQHSPTAAALLSSFLLSHASNSPYGWTHWLQDLWSHTAAYESWVEKIEELTKQLVEFRQCTNTAFEGKMQFSRFPVLLGSAEAQVIWCGIVKCLLIAYFIGNLSAKNIKIRSHVSKVIASQRWDVFWDTVYRPIKLKHNSPVHNSDSVSQKNAA